MAKKRLKRTTKDNHPPLHNTESMMSDLQKLLSQQEFESIDQVNAFMQNLVSSGQPIPRFKNDNPAVQAQDLIYQAWESSPAKAIKLAKKALEIYPDTADAYVILAQNAKTSDEAKNYYEQGVQAGERALGKEIFEDGAGHFWGMIETRPYMRAREGLALLLQALGDSEGAIQHYREMLRLNPHDNQGIRYYLLGTYMEQEQHEAAIELLKQYEDDASPHWTYSWALALFRTEGPTEAAEKHLKTGLKYNPHVPAYLTGQKRISRLTSPYITFGGESEAVDYARSAKKFWEKMPEALTWLKKVADSYRDNPEA